MCSHTRAGEVDGCGRYNCSGASLFIHVVYLVYFFIFSATFLQVGGPRLGRETPVAKALFCPIEALIFIHFFQGAGWSFFRQSHRFNKQKK